MATVEVSDSSFEEKVLKANKPVMVDFWAPWCGPCKMAEPALEELSDEYADDVTIVKMNVDDNKEVPMNYQVMSIPTTVMIKNGEEIGRQIGFAGKQAFEDLIKKAI
jgi:thioredoxin 1